MAQLPRILSVEPVIHGVLKIVFDDGYEGVVDMRPIIAQGRIFSWLEQPEHFLQVKVEEYGHSIVWLNDRGEEIDFSADSLRATAEEQAAHIVKVS